MQKLIMQAVRNFFRKSDWKFDEYENTLMTGVALDGRTTGAMIQVVVTDRSLTVQTAPDLDIPETVFPAVQLFANEINTMLNVGCMYLEREQKIAVFRVGLICTDAVPSEQQIDDAVGYSVAMVQDASEALHDLIEGKLTPESAALRAVQSE